MGAKNRYKHVISEYGQRADQYDLSCQRFLSTSQAAALEALDPRRGEKILDAGCGTGSAMVPIAESVGSGGEVVGIDLSGDMLSAAKRKLAEYDKIVLIEGNVEEISYPDNYFDAVISVNVMHHFHDLTAALKELHRLLKQGGRLVLAGFCTDYLFFSFIEKLWRIFIPSHIRAYSLDEATLKMKEAGFEVMEGKRYKTGWFWRSMILKVRKG